MSSVSFSRRKFLEKSLRGTLAAAAAGAPQIVRSSALGRDGAVAPSDRVAMGLIGCGGHGTGWNLDRMFENADQQVVAVCDVDRRHGQQARQRVQDHYSKTLGGRYQGCRLHDDFRELIEREDIDAVDVATPDHWHVLPAIAAAKAGKHVICEKPLTLTVAEGRVLCDVVDRTKITFQTASENRSIDSYIYCVELVRAGYIGRLTHIDVTLPQGNDRRGVTDADFVARSAPDYFNYDMWLGQAPEAPYCPARCHNTFRWNLDYSGGRLTDWGAHLIDLAQWANDAEASGPVEVRGVGKFPPRDAVWNTAYQFRIDYKYANGVTLNVSSSHPGIRFIGTEGWIGFDGWRAPLQTSRPQLLTVKIKPEERLYRPKTIVARAGGGGGEHRNFVDCIRSGRPCYAPAETGHRTITVAHLGNISMLLGGRTLQWNPQTERFVGDDEANAMLRRPQRAPWRLENFVS